MEPSIGRIVHVKHTHPQVNQPVTSPAIITAVHGSTCVNLTVFPDNHLPIVMSSVMSDENASPRWEWPVKV